MIGRVFTVGVIAALLVSAATVSRAALETDGREPIPAGLLYLPDGPYLRALALGHEETLADLLYVWSIQYYSSYDDDARYDYLDQVFRGAITDLDPLFTEAYLVGGMIMSVEARRPDLARELYDKGIAHDPNDWQLPYWAGWESYFEGKFDLARDYWLLAADVPEAPQFFGRLAARMLEKSGSLDAALMEYQRLLASAEDDKTRWLAQRWIDRTQTEITLNRLDKALERYRERTGRCPDSLQALVDAHVLRTLPQRPDGTGYRFDRERCRALPPAGVSLQ